MQLITVFLRGYCDALKMILSGELWLTWDCLRQILQGKYDLIILFLTFKGNLSRFIKLTSRRHSWKIYFLQVTDNMIKIHIFSESMILMQTKYTKNIGAREWIQSFKKTKKIKRNFNHIKKVVKSKKRKKKLFLILNLTIYFENIKKEYFIAAPQIKTIMKVDASIFKTGSKLKFHNAFSFDFNLLTLLTLIRQTSGLPEIVFFWGGGPRYPSPSFYFLIVKQIYNIWNIFRMPLGFTLIICKNISYLLNL